MGRISYHRTLWVNAALFLYVYTVPGLARSLSAQISTAGRSSNQVEKASILFECILEECANLPPSRKGHCEEACFRYADIQLKTIGKPMPEAEDSILKRSSQLPVISKSIQNSLADIIGFEKGSSFTNHEMRPIFSREAARNENLVNYMTPAKEVYLETELCTEYCSNMQQLTSVENCLMLLCDPLQEKENMLFSLEQPLNNVNDPIYDIADNRHFSARSNTDRNTWQTVDKRWASRNSCPEVKCGTFAGHPGRFLDCSQKLCT